MAIRGTIIRNRETTEIQSFPDVAPVHAFKALEQSAIDFRTTQSESFVILNVASEDFQFAQDAIIETHLRQENLKRMKFNG